MSAVWGAVCAVLFFSVCVNAQTRTLAVYHSSSEPIDSTAIHELKNEVHRLLADAAIDIAWRKATEVHVGDQFDRVAVASFDGNCSVVELPTLLQSSGPTEVLADTHVDKHRHVQPFFHIDCTQIIRNLRPWLDRLNVPMRNVLFGRALGRVVAHEIYHVVAQTTEHADAGVAKPSFSLHDLITERFSFSPASLERLRPAPSFFQLDN
jgi:hypothetical protein